jgi:hypothetical protein
LSIRIERRSQKLLGQNLHILLDSADGLDGRKVGDKLRVQRIFVASSEVQASSLDNTVNYFRVDIDTMSYLIMGYSIDVFESGLSRGHRVRVL